MNDNMIPVYLDCNYDELEAIKNKLNELGKIEINNQDLFELYSTLTGELASRYNYGTINNSNIHRMDEMVLRIASGIDASLYYLKSCDVSERENLRNQVERFLNYSKPIDRSEYPHLSDEKIEEVYDAILAYDYQLLGRNNDFNDLSDDELMERKEVLKLFLNNYMDSRLFCGQFWNVYKTMNKDEREDLYNQLGKNGIQVLINEIDKLDYFYLNSDEFREYGELVSNNLYDEDTIKYIYAGMYQKRNGYSLCLDGDNQFSLKFGDFETSLNWSNIIKYCSSNSFNYLDFFADNKSSNNISDDSNVTFNLDGLECSIKYGKLKEAILSSGVDLNNDEEEQSGNAVGLMIVAGPGRSVSAYQDADDKSLIFIKKLIDANAFSSEDMEKSNDINILGKRINISLNELSKYYDNNEFSVEKLMNSGILKESEYVYYNGYLKNILSLDNLDIITKGFAFDYFTKHGGVKQNGITDLFRNGNSNEIDNLVDFGSKTYNMSEDDVYVVMKSLDLQGACTYADACNIIYELYNCDEYQFENDFGYPMSNTNQLLLDLYIYSNIESKDESLLVLNDKGNPTLNTDYLNHEEYIRMGPMAISDTRSDKALDASKQQYLVYYEGGKGFELLNSFLKTKNNDVLDNYSTVYVDMYSESNGSSDYKKELVEAINNGDPVSLGTKSDDWYIYELGSTKIDRITSMSHAVTPIAATSDGVVVMSWGKEYYLPWEDVGSYAIFKNNNTATYNDNEGYATLAVAPLEEENTHEPGEAILVYMPKDNE